MKKPPRHIFLTILIGAYAVFMAVYFGSDLLRSGQYTRFFVTIAAEALVLVLLFFSLRRRDKLRETRKNESKN